jgi:integrase
MAETGLRPDEALNLPWAHVHADKGMIVIQSFGAWKPKTAASARRVYPSDELMQELLRLPRTGDFVFPGKDPSRPIQNIRSPLVTAVKRAGLTRNGKPLRLSVKLFRKVFATTLAEMGKNHSVVGAMMGHAPGSKMTDQYYTFIENGVKQQNRLNLRSLTQTGVPDASATGNFWQQAR